MLTTALTAVLASTAALVVASGPAYAQETCQLENLTLSATDVLGVQGSSIATVTAQVRVCRTGTVVNSVTRTADTIVTPDSRFVVDWSHANGSSGQDGTAVLQPDGSWRFVGTVRLVVGIVGGKVSGSGGGVGGELPLSTSCLITIDRQWGNGWTANRDKNHCDLQATAITRVRILTPAYGDMYTFLSVWGWLMPPGSLPESQNPRILVCADNDIACQQGTSPPTVCIENCYQANGMLNIQNNPWGTSWSNAFRSGSVSWVRDGIPVGTGGGSEGPGGGTCGPFGDLPCPEGPGEV